MSNTSLKINDYDAKFKEYNKVENNKYIADMIQEREKQKFHTRQPSSNIPKVLVLD